MRSKTTVILTAILTAFSVQIPGMAKNPLAGRVVSSTADLQSMAAKGNANALCQLADCYRLGNGVAKDEQKARDLYERAAFLETHLSTADAKIIGNKKIKKDLIASSKAEDKYALGLMYRDGAGVQQDDTLAAKYLSEASETIPGAQCALAMLYENGIGVPKDLSKAADLYKEAAGKGNGEAQNNLGVLYFKGQGVDKDYNQAAKLFQQAVEQGDVNGYSNLGWLYQHGFGVEKDYAKAAQLYTMAAAHGVNAARYNLGYLYQYGLGVPKDYSKSTKLYQLAGVEKYIDKTLGHQWEGDDLEFNPSASMAPQESSKPRGLALRKLFQ